MLTPGRYVGFADVDDEPFGEKMARLAGKLRVQFTKSSGLEREIEDNLQELGYGV